jgi:aspartyl-tRNA(Asn)/glutamyl-tRNA(Gln) amidotransferase subunit B
MIDDNSISSRGAKDIILLLPGSSKSPRRIALEKNLLQRSNENEIERIADAVLSQNSKIAGEYKNGKVTALQYLIGQGMKLSKGSASPHILRNILEKKLAKSP